MKMEFLGESQNHDGSETTKKTKKKKRFHRHTPHQIQRLESYEPFFSSLVFLVFVVVVVYYSLMIDCRTFNECQHPDEKQRMQLSKELGLAPTQIKFWFQNRRTQKKVLVSLSLSVLFCLHKGKKIPYFGSLFVCL